MSKSSVLKNTTNFHEEVRLLILSVTIFEQPALITQLLIYQIFSMFPYKEMTFRISIQDGTKPYFLKK